MESAFGSFRGFEGFSEEAMASLSNDEKILAMTSWFYNQFEDPQNETPYNKEFGGYAFMWGGPFDASDQIQEEFSSVVDFDLMMLAVDEVQSDGTIEWAPQTGGDFYQHPEDDGVLSGEIVDGDGEWPPIIAEEQPQSEPEARKDAVRRLDELEKLILPILNSFEVEEQETSMMGHNNPPEKMDILQAVPQKEWEQVKVAIDEIRTQALSNNPNVRMVERSNSHFSSAAVALARWIMDRFNGAIDTGIGIGIGYGFANSQAVKEALINAAQAVQIWSNSLIPF